VCDARRKAQLFETVQIALARFGQVYEGSVRLVAVAPNSHEAETCSDLNVA